MKYYLNGVGIFILISFIIGFAVPNLVSAKDTTSVLLGLAILFSGPVLVWYWVRRVFIKVGGEDAIKS